MILAEIYIYKEILHQISTLTDLIHQQIIILQDKFK